MPSLRENLESLELLCWNATEDTIEDKIQDYLKSYPHLKTPATIDLLRQAMKMWFRIQKLEELEKKTTDPAQTLVLITKIDKLNRTWMSMLGNLGVSFTRIQYKGSKKTVRPPMDKLRMLGRKKKK